MKTGIELIAQERSEHFTKGQTVELDVLYNQHNELVKAAVALLNTHPHGNTRPREMLIRMPSKWNNDRCFKMTSKDYKERLAVAGALIAAEIDRLQAIENQKT